MYRHRDPDADHGMGLDYANRKNQCPLAEIM